MVLLIATHKEILMKYDNMRYIQMALAQVYYTQSGVDDLQLYTKLGQRVLDEVGPEDFSHIMVDYNPWLLNRMIDKGLSYREMDMAMQDMFGEIDIIWEIPSF